MLNIEKLEKSYGAVKAIEEVSFEVADGDIFTLLGPSGCGKTTTLQCIAGLEMPTDGQIQMAGTVVYSKADNILVPANRRRLGMVFQSYAIWPHMSVYDNVAFPLVHGERENRLTSDEVRKRVLEALNLVKMEAFADRPAPHLSGGQQQRIALARAIVHRPGLLLLDEPLSNLDAKLRDVMRIELRQLIKALGITTIFVTHDQVEALSMSDRIMLMRGGNIVQIGTPREIYLRPESAFTSDFMGRSNLIPGWLVDPGEGAIETPFGTLHCVMAPGVRRDRPACVAIRPPAIVTRPLASQAPDRRNCFAGSIVEMGFLGDLIEATVAIGGYPVRVALSPYEGLSVGDAVLVDFGEGRCVAVNDDIGVSPALATASEGPKA